MDRVTAVPSFLRGLFDDVRRLGFADGDIAALIEVIRAG